MSELRGAEEQGEVPEDPDSWDEGVDWVSVLYIFGGIPAMVAFFVILFVLVRLFPSIPA